MQDEEGIDTHGVCWLRCTFTSWMDRMSWVHFTFTHHRHLNAKELPLHDANFFRLPPCYKVLFESLSVDSHRSIQSMEEMILAPSKNLT